MAITKVAELINSRLDSGSNRSFTIPAGIKASDLVIAMLASAAPYNNNTNNITIPGWTRVVNKPSQANNTEWLVFWRRGTVSGDVHSPAVAPTDSSFSLVAYDTGGRDVALVGAVGGRSGTSSSVTTVPSVTTTYDNADVILLAAERTLATGTAISSITPTVTVDSFHENNIVASTTYLYAHFAQATKGATGTHTITYSNGSGNGAGILLVIAEPVAATLPPSRLSIIENGAEVQLEVFEVTNADPIRLTCSGRMGMGLTADKLLDKPGFVIAHRGGSVDYAEMSMRSYTQSVFLGADALEYSIARTSDGVYVGLHDQTIDRTTPSVDGQNWDPKNHTYAELQAYMAKAGADTSFGDQPYSKLEDLLATYGQSHCIFFDPKYIAQNQYATLLDYMSAQVPDPTKNLVGKYFFSNLVFARACAARGIKTWGYYYTSDIQAGSHVTTADEWTFVGLEYTATQAIFDTLASTGRPIISHIAPDKAAYQLGLSKGAVGMMVSGIRSVFS